ncbi:hypothetical protein HBI18_213170 [Parastagonospora nodorum]|nr:hypothetical protein HBH77_202190 [Parastagonospora nodorum]KAH5712127.1 hypothetical protein HBI18_213170 [Parastagonospora nodorum]
MAFFNSLVVDHWHSLEGDEGGRRDVVLNGRSLKLADVVAVARLGLSATLSPEANERISRSAEAIQKSIDNGEIIYGVNTGFGGSADTRTQKIENLQREIMRGLNYGILDGDLYSTPLSLARAESRTKQHNDTVLPLDNKNSNHMPASWVRATMLIRLNTLSNGASGVRVSTIQTLFKMLQEDVVPITPLRGSISASGDLSPLSYVGGAMCGKPNLSVWSSGKVTTADRALQEKNIEKVRLGPKEGLAIVNGTAASASVGALAMHEALNQAALSQVLTAMSVEALLGTDESFDTFFSEVRPHPGQADVATAVSALLRGSDLMQKGDGSEQSSLRQDRYSLRTTPQWIGPVLEDFMLAHQQIVTELNSVTDNPLIDTTTTPSQPRTIHGGNFQARSITSAMEKIRQGVQGIGRMLFTQCTELINPNTSRGLPPNLVFDEPSESYIWKGTDIMIAALTSELGFLANPVGTHVQTAEMGNQSLNSLALISARYTLEALSVLTQLSSAHLVALCQALDLRAMGLQFLAMLEPLFCQLFASKFGSDSFIKLRREDEATTENGICWSIFTQRLAQVSTQNTSSRFKTAVSAVSSHLLPLLSPESLATLQIWATEAEDLALRSFHASKDIYLASPDATPYVGTAARKMYDFVRNELRIPFICNDSISTPQDTMESGTSFFDEGLTHQRKGMNMGDVITEVYRAQRSGKLYGVVVECLKEAGLGRTGLEKESPTLLAKQDAGGANVNLKRPLVEGDGGLADEHGVEVRERAEKRRKSMSP